jgi:hypothetical protein
MICAAGDNRGTGFDRSFEAGREGANPHAGLTFVKDFYSESYADRPADVIICRHVLEHIEHPSRLLDGLRRTLETRAGTLVYFEVPSALFTLKDFGIWDLIYEHCSYFTPTSLERAFVDAGFRVLDQGEAFGSQFLYLEAVLDVDDGSPRQHGLLGLDELGDDIAAFRHKYQSKVSEWRKKLGHAKEKGETTVVWGAGSKGVTFVNVLRDIEAVDYVVDLNPHKQDRFVPGTGLRVVSPSFLKESRPDQVIVMNEVYLEEINAMLKDIRVDAHVRPV